MKLNSTGSWEWIRILCTAKFSYQASTEAVVRRCSVKKLCRSLNFNEVSGWRPATFLRKTSVQVFSCEFCTVFKNIYFIEHLWMAPSENTCTTKKMPAAANAEKDIIHAWIVYSWIGESFERASGNRAIQLTTSVDHHVETSQLICRANKLTGFYMLGNTGR